MDYFKLQNEHDVDQKNAEKLSELKADINFIPNVFLAIAASENGLASFIELNNQFSNTSFSDTEKQIILLATSTENQCGYCVAGHTTFSKWQEVPIEHIFAMRNYLPLQDKKLDVLNQFTRTLVRERGQLPESLIKAFFAAGYTQQNAIEIILGISLKTFSNLTSILMKIPLDAAFSENAWSPNKPMKMTA